MCFLLCEWYSSGKQLLNEIVSRCGRLIDLYVLNEMVSESGDWLITVCTKCNGKGGWRSIDNYMYGDGIKMMAMEIKLGEPLIPSIVTAAFIKIYLRFRISTLDFLLL